jgi:transposase InsO family protein
METIRLVEGSELSAKRTLEELGVAPSTFYRWYKAYQENGVDGLAGAARPQRRFWNQIPEHERQTIVDVALADPRMSPRDVAWHVTDSKGIFVSESSVYRILKAFDLITSPNFILVSAKDRFDRPTKRIHELWQTDFTYFKIVGWGWYYLLTVLDDFSRYIVSWKLFTGMAGSDVALVLDAAIASSSVEHVEVRHRPRLLSDNGPCFISKELRLYLEKHGMAHTRGKPYHPMTQGKIERYHRTLKNAITLQNYYLPGELEAQIEAFVRYYNHERVHEALDNLTPADVYHGRARDIRTARDRLKEQTLRRRKRFNMGLPTPPEDPILPSVYRLCVS